MGYPGDQGKPGGWSPDQPPQAPYGPGAERPEAAPYGNDKDESPFTRRGGEAFGGEAFGGAEPFGGSDRFGGAEQFGPASSTSSTSSASSDSSGFSGSSWGDDPAGATLQAPGSFTGQDAGGSGTGPFGVPPGAQSHGQGGFDAPGGFGGFGGSGDQGEQGGFGFDAPGGPGEPGYGFSDAPPGGGHDSFGGSDPSGGPTPPQRRRNLPLIIGGAAVAGLVLIGGGVGLSSMMKDDPKPKEKAPAAVSKSPAPKPSPTVPALEPVKLKSRNTDPKPLTLSEVFGKKTFKSGGQKYVRTAASAKRGCKGVVGGVKLTGTLKKGGCTQTLRATYARGDGKLIGTVGVLNLKTETAAKLAVKAAAAKDAFLQALPGAGTTKKIGKGEALGTAEARGHYLVMTWVQRPDGKKIPPAYHKTVSAFGTQVVKDSNLSFALAYRETEGKPYRD
ncbi:MULTISPECIES: hypothetical protein [Actinomadura]|uniref:Uncharacterized protein n=1 Tax=Actinomadura yumaensis TaxID=111807 RepID=A0ABW2CR39_9ACTN|nr:hypothetical protein [Actinomadura sp. J1-007]MWK35942.1 hypothetical protein [Actinomadura sp. J1-007]